jgi:hypothetical protein
VQPALSEDELAYMRGMRFIKSDFVDFLGLFRLNENITLTPQDNGEIDIRVRGPWLHTILFEIPVLAIVNEVYFRNTQPGWTWPRPPPPGGKIELMQAPGLEQLKIADYGTRRRFSRVWQREVLQTLQQRLGTGDAGQLTGTSNVLFAMSWACAPGHHGARIPAGLPGAGPAPARHAGVRLREVGAGVPGRPGHRAVRRVRHERLPARLRHVLLQAVRRRAPRLGRPLCGASA